MGANYIEFPKLGIHLGVDPIAFSLNIFGMTLSVHWYGAIIALAILVALILALRQTKKFGIKEDDLIDMFLIALPVSIIFARLFFVAGKWELYRNDILGIFRIWEGGVTIYGAIAGAVLSVWIFSRIRKVNMWQMADFACVYLPLAQAIGRWGNFFNQELYGKNTDLPWGMTGSIIKAMPDPGINPDIPVHPTFLYESLWNILVFILLLRIRKRNKVLGRVFAWYLLLYSFGRFMMEFLRVDVFNVGSVRIFQVMAAVVFTGAAIFLVLLSRRAAGKEKTEVEPEAGRSAYADVIDKLNEDKHEESAWEKIYSNDTPVDLGDNKIDSAGKDAGSGGTGENSGNVDSGIVDSGNKDSGIGNTVNKEPNKDSGIEGS